MRNTSEVRSVPAPRTVVTTSTVSVPARPIAPPARPGDGGEGSWQLAWVWTPEVAGGEPGESVPVTGDDQDRHCGGGFQGHHQLLLKAEVKHWPRRRQ